MILSIVDAGRQALTEARQKIDELVGEVLKAKDTASLEETRGHE